MEVLRRLPTRAATDVQGAGQGRDKGSENQTEYAEDLVGAFIVLEARYWKFLCSMCASLFVRNLTSGSVCHFQSFPSLQGLKSLV
jgi:hypothetical protein